MIDEELTEKMAWQSRSEPTALEARVRLLEAELGLLAADYAHVVGRIEDESGVEQSSAREHLARIKQVLGEPE